ncbi:MAG: SH3 domain-containing protein [Ardenticatenaceae bacterium]|nr:SH3 domain-containing protein [Ardenticatenaceae bacterium]
MTFVLPLLVTFIALVAIFYAYTNIRQGAARVYTLEREAILRRGTNAMFLGAFLMALTIGWLLYQGQVALAPGDESAEENNVLEAVEGEGSPVGTPVPSGDEGDSSTTQLPGLETVTPTPTIDPDIPTATPTPIVIRAFVTGTGGNGLTMRTTPGGEQITILNEDEFVTVLEEEGREEQGGRSWVKVQNFLGEEGWVAEDFLEFETR